MPYNSYHAHSPIRHHRQFADDLTSPHYYKQPVQHNATNYRQFIHHPPNLFHPPIHTTAQSPVDNRRHRSPRRYHITSSDEDYYRRGVEDDDDYNNDNSPYRSTSPPPMTDDDDQTTADMMMMSSAVRQRRLPLIASVPNIDRGGYIRTRQLAPFANDVSSSSYSPIVSDHTIYHRSPPQLHTYNDIDDDDVESSRYPARVIIQAQPGHIPLSDSDDADEPIHWPIV
jgi:hypothetical protein